MPDGGVPDGGLPEGLAPDGGLPFGLPAGGDVVDFPGPDPQGPLELLGGGPLGGALFPAAVMLDAFCTSHNPAHNVTAESLYNMNASANWDVAAGLVGFAGREVLGIRYKPD